MELALKGGEAKEERRASDKIENLERVEKFGVREDRQEFS